MSECATKDTQTHHYIIHLAPYSILEDWIWDLVILKLFYSKYESF